MKRTLCIFTLVGLVAAPVASFAQNNPSAPPADSAAKAGAASANTPAAEAVAPGAASQTAGGAPANKPSSTLIVAN